MIRVLQGEPERAETSAALWRTWYRAFAAGIEASRGGDCQDIHSPVGDGGGSGGGLCGGSRRPSAGGHMPGSGEGVGRVGLQGRFMEADGEGCGRCVTEG